MLEREFQIQSPAGRALRISAHARDFSDAQPAIVICHGFCGFKDWGWMPYLAQRLAELGLAAFRMNFSHNGIGEDPQSFTELEAFEANTFGKMLADIGAVLKTIARLPWVDTKRVSLLGHSVGGGVVTLFGAQNQDLISKVVGWNPVARCNRYGPEKMQELADSGSVAYFNGRTKQTLYTGAGFFADLEANAEERDIVKAAGRLGSKLLVVQGSNDSVVTPEDSRLLADASSAATLHTVLGGDHVFNCGHPFAEAARELEEAIWKSAEFLKSGAEK